MAAVAVAEAAVAMEVGVVGVVGGGGGGGGGGGVSCGGGVEGGGGAGGVLVQKQHGYDKTDDETD